MHREKPTSGAVYHIYNRGVEKRKIFQKSADYWRFIHDLFEFNNENPTVNTNYNLSKHPSIEDRLGKDKKPRKLLVNILAFVLMPNHFHLMLRAKKEDGITEFMRKLGTGYTNYFNKKYQRVGPLFQGKYKCLRLKRDAHFIRLPLYIHLNPLELLRIKGKAKEGEKVREKLKFLRDYRFSSYLDYTGIKNLPSITQRQELKEYLGGPKRFKEYILSQLKEGSWRDLGDYTLE